MLVRRVAQQAPPSLSSLASTSDRFRRWCTFTPRIVCANHTQLLYRSRSGPDDRGSVTDQHLPIPRRSDTWKCELDRSDSRVA